MQVIRQRGTVRRPYIGALGAAGPLAPAWQTLFCNPYFIGGAGLAGFLLGYNMRPRIISARDRVKAKAAEPVSLGTLGMLLLAAVIGTAAISGGASYALARRTA